MGTNGLPIRLFSSDDAGIAMGVLGFATLLATVFADVGVALLVVLNSVRILNKKF